MTSEESTKCKERQLLGRKNSFGLEEKRAAENTHHLGFGPSGAPCIPKISIYRFPARADLISNSLSLQQLLSKCTEAGLDHPTNSDFARLQPQQKLTPLTPTPDLESPTQRLEEMCSVIRRSK
jgi:hypothetical protein